MTETAADIMSKARSALIQGQPFWGTLALSMELKETRRVETMATNGVVIMYNPEHVLEKPFLETVAEIAHEVTHCASFHHTRRGNREHKLWNVACDESINHILKEAGFQLGADWLLDPRFVNMSADKVYDILYDERQKGGGGSGQQPSKGKAPGGAKAKGGAQAPPDPNASPGAPGEDYIEDPGGAGAVIDAPAEEDGMQANEADLNAQEQEWQVKVIQASNVAKAAGQLPGSAERFAEAVRNPDVDWQRLLEQFMQAVASGDYSWKRPNRRHIDSGLYLPSLYSEELGTIVIVNDNSGSVGDREQAEFCGHVTTILEDLNPREIILIHCDARVQRVDRLTPEDLPIKFDAPGRGGTSFKPPFEWLEKNHIEDVECLIYLTDLEGDFPARAPMFPVLWCSVKDHVAPFGETIPIKVR